MAPRRNAASLAAEISLVHLEKCLVNLPPSLVSLLVNANSVAQNVVVELSYHRVVGHGHGHGHGHAQSTTPASVYVGWTGMPSKRKLAPVVGRHGLLHGYSINGSSRVGSGRERDHDVDLALVEIDAKFAATLGLQDGQKVTAQLYVDPPTAHTINIEPLTAEDWEMIELHATFLEINLLNQIRAVPNPVHAPHPHPLTLHLSPTATANIKVVSFEPALPADAPFAKIAPDAEVIVAPKTRPRPSRSNRDSKSLGGTSKRSGRSGRSGRSSASTVKRRGAAREAKKPCLFLRGIDRRHCAGWCLDGGAKGAHARPDALTVWVDKDLVLARDFRGVKWVAVNVVRPAGLQPPLDPQKQAQAQNGEAAARPATRVVARLLPWSEPPDGQTAALSPPLCAALGSPGMVGGVVRIEPAPASLPRKTAPDAEGRVRDSVQSLKVYPFLTTGSKSQDGLKFGGESRAEREEAANRVKHMYGWGQQGGLLAGPITDGQILGVTGDMGSSSRWAGGIVKFDPAPEGHEEEKDAVVSWILLGADSRLSLDLQPAIPAPTSQQMDAGGAQSVTEAQGEKEQKKEEKAEEEEKQEEEKREEEEVLVGIDSLLQSLHSHLSHLSSVLLTGGQGSGKTSVARSVARTLRADRLFHTTYLACRSLVNQESRISTIKETLTRVFMAASWGARLGGRALVVLDDLDKLCPAETELQVGNENGRSRLISEAICAMARQYCAHDSNVVLLATSQGKDSLHNVVVGGHIIREMVDLSAPDKDARRKMMEALARQHAVAPEALEEGPQPNSSRPATADGSTHEANQDDWMDGASPSSPMRKNPTPAGFIIDPDLDFLEVAGETDGYMPGDLRLLVARARSEALIRSISDASTGRPSHRDRGGSSTHLARRDFRKALKGFTPASLRNVPLQSSTTTFDSIGGLRETRRVLLETLQYPTKYAPLFAQCPLRLRSGLLLYGFPGCGKTLLASAVAGECGLNFISVKGPEILNKYIGASEKSVRDLFARAQAARPCVLFFDEFDSIAPKRGHDSTGVTDRVVNQLLTQMDGAEGLSGVYVLAATSRPDLIDPALLRPGRLDKSLLCPVPDLDDRLDILRALGRKVRLGPDVLASEADLVELGRRTENFSGADLQALLSNAQLEAIHEVLQQQQHQDPDGRAAGADPTRAPPRPGAHKTTSGFVQFRYGQDGDDAAAAVSAGATQASDLAEQAAIAAKLEGIKLARKCARQQQQQQQKQGQGVGTRGPQQASGEVVIGWKHLVKALEGTRASISAEERRRLESIYRDFVVGRSGEMRDGQGSMAIGGRSSLM
ncbi:hypothetical protein P8C59_007797 [Phyllachora maydis]|uniref:Peroxisomal ATPase PEX1 n=1 Tax=Phyllachora maydis TaxID=1825666 RepID=A0AAD9MIU3_9PEZI|nr:hypothetical protein P8C59_007797 [Phyllachora maydis]